MSVYVPGTQEKDLSKVIMSLQALAGAPHRNIISGTTGASTIAAGSTNYVSPGQLNATESLAYVSVPIAGVIRNLFVYSQGSPGVGQTYTYTFRKTLADTALTCTIGAGVNTASDTTNIVSMAAGDRWSIKVGASAGAAATNVMFSFEFDFT